MSIAIIGTGNMAAALGRCLVRAREHFLVAARDPSKAQTLASKLGSSVQGGEISAMARQADLLVLAVPFAAVGEVLSRVGDLGGKVLIDITNPLTPNYMALTIGHTTSAAEEIQKLAPTVPVVKAFNTLFAAVLEAPADARGLRQVFIAADDQSAEARVAEIVRRMGFEAVYAGPLANARYLEPVAELNIQLGFALGRGTHISPAWVGLSA